MEKQGKVVGVCMSQRRTDPKKNIGKSFLQKGLGLVGDSHAGTEKEVSLLAVESIHKLCQETGISAGPGCFAENITTEGIDLTSLPIGSQLQVGEAKLYGDSNRERSISSPILTIIRDILFYPKEGVFCKVIEGGEVKIGNTIRLIQTY